jgi:hypothetical protein
VVTIALPSLTIPTPDLARLKTVVANRYVGAGAAALLLAAAAFGLMKTLGPSPGHSGAVRVPLAGVFARAPQGWRETLTPLHGPARVSQDVIRLSEHPLASISVASWNHPGKGLPPPPPGAPLAAAPMAGFFAPGPAGPLPIIAQDGRTPFEAYRRPFLPNGRPKVALVIGGLGLNTRATEAAIETLPAEITLSFSPYAEGLQGWVDMARAHGHEVLLETPMEPRGRRPSRSWNGSSRGPRAILASPTTWAPSSWAPTGPTRPSRRPCAVADWLSWMTAPRLGAAGPAWCAAPPSG